MRFFIFGYVILEWAGTLIVCEPYHNNEENVSCVWMSYVYGACYFVDYANLKTTHVIKSFEPQHRHPHEVSCQLQSSVLAFKWVVGNVCAYFQLSQTKSWRLIIIALIVVVKWCLLVGAQVYSYLTKPHHFGSHYVDRCQQVSTLLVVDGCIGWCRLAVFL